MKKYTIAVKSTQTCYVTVEAESADAAKTIADVAIDDSPGLDWESFDKYSEYEPREAEVVGTGSAGLPELSAILDSGCDHRMAYYFHENAPKYCPICGEYLTKEG